MISYFWPPNVGSGHSATLAPWGGGLLLPRLIEPTCFNYTAGASGLVAQSVVVNTGTPGGFISGIEDDVGGVWLLAAVGDVSYLSTTQELSYSLPGVASGIGFVGSALRNGAPYFVAQDGALYTVEGASVTPVSPSFGQNVSDITSDGVKVYAPMPDSGNLAVYTFSSQTAGGVTLVPTPMTVPVFAAANSNGAIGVGGWNASTYPYGATDFSLHPNQAMLVAADPYTNKILMFSGTDPLWSFASSVSGTGSPVQAKWASSGEQVLAADTTNNEVQVFTLQNGLLSPGQVLAVSGVTSMGMSSDGLEAFLAQPSKNMLTVLSNSLNVWSASQTITGMTAPSSVLVLGANSAVVGSSGNLNWLVENVNQWAVQSSVSGVGFTPTGLATDGAGTIFAVGSSGGTGYLAAINKSSILATTSWSGSANAVYWDQDQIAVADKANSEIRSFSLIGSALVQQGTAVAPAGVSAIGSSPPISVWLGGSSVIAQMQFTAPFDLVPQVSGVVSIYTAGTWFTNQMGVGRQPCAGAWDASGVFWVATEEDELDSISVSGVTLSTTALHPSAISPTGLFPPLGISDMVWFGSGLFASSSLSEALLQIAGTSTSVIQPPSPPTNIGVNTAATTSSSIEITWSASLSTPAPSYTVQYRVTGTTAWSFGVATSGTYAIIGGLKPNTEYDFQVYAQNTNGVSVASPVVNGTTSSSTVATKPSAPTNLVVTE